MYLSRLFLDTRVAGVRRDLGDCHALHRRVMTAFPPLGDVPDARARCGVLFRVEPQGRERTATLLVQSLTEPNWELAHLPVGYTTDAVRPLAADLASVAAGQVRTFRLRANATKWTEESKRPDPTPHRVALVLPHEQLAWLARQGERGGFAPHTVEVLGRDPDGGEVLVTLVADVRVTSDPWVQGHSWARTAPDLTLGAVRYEGRLRITDADRFRATLRDGVGRGKAFGFGLLSVLPPRE